MSGSAADDSFAAYQEAAKGMSAKRGSTSRTVSGDDVVVTGSHRVTVVKTEPTSSSQGRKTRGSGVMTRVSHQSVDIDGIVLPVGDTTEVIQVLQGGLLRVSSCMPSEVLIQGSDEYSVFLQTVSQLFHLGERLSTEDVSSVRGELEALKREASEEKDCCMALELEVRDLKEKLKRSEKTAEEASADALATSQENQKLAEDIKTAAENFKL
ncbi:hypothetical protein Bca4012_026845 [Brassica carinata]